MAGIYIHIPYCKQACHYCNFYFSTSLKSKNDFVPALLKEMELRQDYLGEESVETIYFGGGTPSLISPAGLNKIIARARALFRVDPGVEITLEANPDDIHEGTAAAWKDASINRLSIGIQSFFDEDLIWMNRAHHANQARESVRKAQDAGFDNISIDLIYGGPTLPDDHWEKNLQEAVTLKVPHLSCYALTVEPGTALQKMILLEKKADVQQEDQARQFVLLMEWMEKAGYEHYEISNFALPGKRSRHNAGYWQGKKYLGLGPSAHSYDGNSRQWNISNNADYIAAINRGELKIEKEQLTRVQTLNEYIMTSLRTVEGLHLQYVNEKFGAGIREEVERNAQQFLAAQKMKNEGARLVLTKDGKLFADGIAASLFFEEDES